MNEGQSGGGWGILIIAIVIVAIVGGMIYLIGDVSAQRERAVADQLRFEAQIESARAYAQVEIAQAHEEGSTERMQVFALTLKALTTDHTVELMLLAIGVALLGVLQIVQFMTRPR